MSRYEDKALQSQPTDGVSHRLGEVNGIAFTPLLRRCLYLGMNGLPGAELIEAGLQDLSNQVESIQSLLVSIGAPRLRSLGYPVEHPFPNPELRLYEILAADDSDGAHSRYNALIRRLVSFERAAECVR